MNITSLINSMGGVGSVGAVGQILARVAWVCKILAWIKKKAWVISSSANQYFER